LPLDPSGYFFKFLKKVAKVWRSAWRSIKKYGRQIVAIVAAFYTVSSEASVGECWDDREQWVAGAPVAFASLNTEHKHFIYADGQLIAIHIKTDTTSAKSTSDTPATPIPDKTRYLHYDNLGSIDTITDGCVRVQ
jgi:hypothetical protein